MIEIDDDEYQIWQAVSLLLYIILIFEILVFYVFYSSSLALGLSIVLVTVLWIGRLLVNTNESKLASLKNLLVSLIGTSDQVEHIDLDYETKFLEEIEEIEAIYDSEGLASISDLRSIGFDGILILMFLTKNYPKLCDTKVIIEHLDLPTSSTYRNMNHLKELGLVSSQQTLDEPGVMYYQINQEGIDYIRQLQNVLFRL